MENEKGSGAHCAFSWCQVNLILFCLWQFTLLRGIWPTMRMSVVIIQFTLWGWQPLFLNYNCHPLKQWERLLWTIPFDDRMDSHRKHDNKTWDPHFCLSPGCGLWSGIQYPVRTPSLLHGSLCDWGWGPATKTLGAFRKMGEEKERAMRFDPWQPTLFWSAWIMRLTPSVWPQHGLALLTLSLSPGSVFCLCPTSLD